MAKSAIMSNEDVLKKLMNYMVSVWIVLSYSNMVHKKKNINTLVLFNSAQDFTGIDS